MVEKPSEWRRCSAAVAAMLLATVCAAATASETAGAGAVTAPAPQAAIEPAGRQVFFGDLHLHTSYSLDAAAAKTETVPDDAYRFAMGEPVSYLGRKVQRRAPLDFLAVTDHAEYLGNVRLAMRGDIQLQGSDWPRLFAHHGGATMFELFGKAVAGLFGEDTPGLSDPARVHDNWQDIIAAAERHNRPGKFTTFVAFEYSPTFRSNPAAHLHRNVIFRGPTYPAMPFAATDSMKPEALWAYAETNRARGMDSLMIPHNANLSYGRAFADEDSYGKPFSREYALMRARNEPLVEITQIKGTSETRPEISPDDEFADFELIDAGKDQPTGSYIRPGLQRGMQIAERIGVNPFEQGFVGASDFHSGISASEEDNFPGGLGLSDDLRNPRAVLEEISPVLGTPLSALSASGITGVWADANTRAAIFAALRRRETFATSGPRIRVRLFAGWGSAGDMMRRADWATRAYRWGVPMGGTLATPPAGSRGPVFLVQASKDPLSGNLDRIQIIKLWLDHGKARERIYDVAWSPGRKRDGATGRLQPVGNTVDVAHATYTNAIGAAELAGTWRDPEFDPAQPAIYYARVIEIPTPRWATYLAARSGLPLGGGIKAWLQERAWTSPVYYRP
jgi:hypothetical protein